MRPSKAISTASYWLNLGISSDRYYTVQTSKSLDSARSYWDGKILILEVDGEQHKFQYLGKDISKGNI